MAKITQIATHTANDVLQTVLNTDHGDGAHEHIDIWSGSETALTPTRLDYYFATAEDTHLVEAFSDLTYTAQLATATTRLAAHKAFKAIDSYVVNLSFSEVNSSAAAELNIQGATRYNDQAANYEGVATLPGSYMPNGNPSSVITFDQTLSQFGTSGYNLGDGNYRNWIVTHEIGHALGLPHPHAEDDPWSASGAFPSGSALNNEKYTVMSYLSANKTSLRNGHSIDYMALDIAALQFLYGKGSNNISDTVYSLFDGGQIQTDNAVRHAVDTNGSNGDVSIGQGYFSIWDYDTNATNENGRGNGGIDTLQYGNADNSGQAQSAWLNLNDASLSLEVSAQTDKDYFELMNAIKASPIWDELTLTLQNEIDASADPDTDLAAGAYHAGGFFSYLFQKNDEGQITDIQKGGFSIANGVVIENATGGGQDDILIGNEVGNTLKGLAGDDILFGGAGVDALFGGAGDDNLIGGSGNDGFIDLSGTNIIDGGDGIDAVLSAQLSGIDLSRNADGDIVLSTQSYTNTLVDIEHILSLQDLLGATITYQISDTNRASAENGILLSTGETSLSGGDGHDYLSSLGSTQITTHLNGNKGNDIIKGGANNDIINGGTDDDILFGGNGADQFIFGEDFGHDRVLDYNHDFDLFAPSADLTLTELSIAENDVILDYGEDGDIIFEDYADDFIALLFA